MIPFLFGLFYLASAEAGRLFSLQGGTYVSFWLPAGLYLAVLLLSQKRTWPWLVLAAVCGNILFDALHGTPARAIPFFCLANALQATVGAWLIGRYVTPKLQLNTLRELIGLLFFGAALSTVVGAAIGAATLVSTGLNPSFVQSFQVWWGSCAMAILIFSPFVLTWLSPIEDERPMKPARILEATLLVAGMALVTMQTLKMHHGVQLPNKMWVVPFLLWGGLRFGIRGATATSLGLGTTLSLYTAFHLQRNPLEPDAPNALFLMQTSMAVSALVALIPAIVLRERDQTTAELRASQKRFELAMRGTNDGYWDWNILTNEVYYSDRFRQLLGYRPDEFPPTFESFHSHLHPDDRALVQNGIKAHLERQVQYDVEYRLRTKSGDFRWFHARGHAVWNRDGSPTRMAGSITDITERHQAEAALRESEQKFSTAFRASPDVMSITELESGRYLEVNDVHEALFGISRAEVIGRSPLELGIISSPAQHEALVNHLKEKGSVRDLEVRANNRAGEDLILLLSAEVIQLNGRACVLRVSHDVTQSKRAQETLQESEERYRKVVEFSPECVAISIDDRLVYVNPAGVKMLGGRSGDDFIGHSVYDFVPSDSREDIECRRQSVLTSGVPTAPFESPLVRLDGTTVITESIAVPFVFQKQSATLCLIRDVTERKRAEDSLRESEERYRTVVEFSPECVAISIDRHLAYINPAGVKMFGGNDPRQFIGRPAYDFVPPAARESIEQRRRALIEHGIPTFAYESTMLRLDGSTLVCEASVVPFIYQGRPATLALIRDITERKRAEESLRESEKRFRGYFELPIVGLAITSLEKGFVAVNDQFCEIVGYPRDELVKLRWSELTHPDDLAADVNQFNCVLAGEQDGYTLEKRFIRKDKTLVPTAVSVRCVRRADGSPDYFIAMLQDITERKRAEQERTDSARREQRALEEYTRRLIASQEAERRRIAGELHDSLGQNLLLIRNRVQQALDPQNLDLVRQQLTAIGQLASEAIAEVRNISHDLRPYQLDQLGFTYALQSLVDGVAQSSGIRIDRKLDQADDALTPEGATNLYRIVQECLTNILKHSQARQVKVELERDVRHLWLWIKDDGTGFSPVGADSSSSKGGLGLRNIAERVRILDGTLKIHSAPGQGTSIEITVTVADLETTSA